MGIGDILCEYIYSSFLLVKAALEVAQKTCKMLLTSLDTLFNTLLALCRYVIDVGIQAILNGIRVFQKWLVDSLLNYDFTSLCQGLFRCTEFMQAIVDPNSLLSRTIQKYTHYDPALQTEIYNTLNDFNEFKSQICNFGLTYNFGLSAVKKMLGKFSASCKEFLDMLERYKERIRRFLQKYLDTCIDIGIFDMLDRLKAFFSCVLLDTDVCSNIRTANSFYKTCLRKMCLEESGDGYQLDSNVSAQYLNTFNSRINQLNNSKQELNRFIDSIISPSQVNAANNAFNLASNIFPGGASWSDIKKGDFWKKNKCYQYFKMKRRTFKKLLGMDSSTSAMGIDDALNNVIIDDSNGLVILTINTQNGMEEKRYTADFIASKTGDNPIVQEEIEYNIMDSNDKLQTNLAIYDKTNDEIMSTLTAAIEVSVKQNEDLKKQLQSKITMGDYAKVQDVVHSYK